MAQLVKVLVVRPVILNTNWDQRRRRREQVYSAPPTQVCFPYPNHSVHLKHYTNTHVHTRGVR